VHDNRRMASRLLTFLVWALVAGSGLSWGFKLFVRPSGLPEQARAVSPTPPQAGGYARVMGTVEETPVAAAPVDSRFHLLGIVAPKGSAHEDQAVALISVGSDPARPWRPGSVIDGNITLLSVKQRAAQLGPKGGPVTAELVLPDPSEAKPSTPAATKNTTRVPTQVRRRVRAPQDHSLEPGAPVAAPNPAVNPQSQDE
jgi:general secretion pathway protein C